MHPNIKFGQMSYLFYHLYAYNSTCFYGPAIHNFWQIFHTACFFPEKGSVRFD